MIEKFKKFLLEKIESDNYLYHFTHFSYLLNILKDDVLKGNIQPIYKNVDSNEIDFKYKSKPFISLTRDRNLNFAPIRLKLNSNKLKNNFEIIKFNFQDSRNSLNECEERIYKDVKNIKKYIEEISIHSRSLSMLGDDGEDSFYKDLWELKDKIPITYF